MISRHRKQSAKWTDEEGTHVATVTVVERGKHKGERRVLIETDAYYGKYLDGDGRRRCVALGTDFQAAQSALNKLVRQGEREREGIDCASARRETEPIDRHIVAFIRTLKTTGNQTRKRGRRTRKPVTADSAKSVEHHIQRIVGGCGFSRLVDIAAGKVDAYMLTLAATIGPVTLNKHLTNAPAFVTWFRKPIRRRSASPVRSSFGPT